MKKILSIIISAVMLVSIISVVFANGIDSIPEVLESSTFNTFLPSEWAKESVESAKSMGIIDNEKVYNYQKPITREEFCELVYSYLTNVLGNVLDEEIKLDEYKRVVDTESYAVQCLVGMGIIEGKSVVEICALPLADGTGIPNFYDITFAPSDYLTREEAATILLRLINKTIDVPATEMYFEFEDGNEISDWANNAVQVMCNLDVMKGVGENKFAPKDTYTTEQAIATVVRVYDAQSKVRNILGNGSPAAYTHDFNYKLNQMMPEDKNYMFSPLSLKMAFAMVANGAEGETQAQLLNALGIEDLDAFNEYAKSLMATYNGADVLKLNVANSLWINKDHMQKQFTKEFQELAKEYYGAEVNVVDDGNALEEINGWANEQTFGKIPKVIDAPEFETILANALYFKGSWQSEFSKSATHKAVFISRDGSEKEIDFMKRTGYFQYYDNGGNAVIALPYKSSQPKVDEEGNYLGTEKSEADISMYLIQGEYNQHTDILKGFARNRDREKTYITLKMPKFEFEFETGLNDMMNKLGAVDAFIDGKAQLNPMIENGNNRYYIKGSTQKTYIKVDEEGTEAAAVTIVKSGATSYQERPEPIEVTFDKPFTFVIYDNANNEVLFMGEYAFAE